MNIFLPRLALAAISLTSLSLTVWAQSAADAPFASTSLAAYPPNISEGTGGPMMMLTASRDHTLFAPIYTDYEDIDGDGEVDYTFKPTERYYGYFDAKLCYSYNSGRSAGARFEPKALATLSDEKAPRLVCPSSQKLWSGNFLNWATMTRLDVVRKTLYGGHRVEDTLDDTTLQMAALAHDAHSFVKYYAGRDIGDYTPFTHDDLGGAGLTMCSRGSSNDGLGVPQLRLAKGNYSLWATTPGTVCNWAVEQKLLPTTEQKNFTFGAKARAFYLKYGPPPVEGESAEDAAKRAHHDTLPDSDLKYKTTVSDGGAEVVIGSELAIRVQACAKDFVGKGGERCRTYQRTVSGVTQNTYKPIGLLQEFGTSEQARQPVRAEFGLITGSYDHNFLGGQLRKNIGSVNDEVEVGTGRFCHLLDAASGGSCKVTKATYVGPNKATTENIIRAFDGVRMYSAEDFDAKWRNMTPSVPYPLPREVSNGNYPSWGNPMSEMVTQALAYFAGLDMGGIRATVSGRDAEVGLPVSVVARDPLKDTDNDPIAGVSRKELYGRAICRPMHMLAISSGAVTHDTDEPGDGEDVYGTATAFMSKNTPSTTIQKATDDIGEREGINKFERSVGSVSGAFGVDCTAKQIGTVVTSGLSQVAGVCPEAPALKGTYLGAGAAFIANTKAVRSLSELTEDTGGSVALNRLPAHALRVRSHVATLSGGVARIEVPIPGKGFVYITPESSWDFQGWDGKQTNGDLMPGAMLTFRSIGGDSNSASYVVTWNDAQFGGDYDMDIVGFLRWERRASKTSPGAYELTVMTDILNYEAGARGAHGFSIIGTDKTAGKDGRYLTHGGGVYDPYSASSDCAALPKNEMDFQIRCSYSANGMPTGGAAPDPDKFAWPTKYGATDINFYDEVTKQKSTTVAKTFLVTEGVANVALHDPLWYIAKYGGFNTGETKFALSTNAVPDAENGANPVNWDRQNNDGKACDINGCADGEPDSYFLARRPELLEVRLRNLLRAITQGSNSAPAVSSSQLLSTSFKYTAEFYLDGFGGTVKAYPMDNGSFRSSPQWSASTEMTGANRSIITDNGTVGLVFDWASLKEGEQAASYRAALMGIASSATPTETQTARAESLIGYMRGGEPGTLFRVRKDKEVMGPIVNSTPWLQSGEVAGRYTDADFPAGAPSYRTFVNKTKASAEPVLWVGSNDGMLHGLNALLGTPIMSYVPSPLVGRLASALAAGNQDAVALMDGNPYTADVLVSDGFGFRSAASEEKRAWRTYLFSSLGRGGRAVFALDVTDPASLKEAGSAASAFKWVFSSQHDSGMGYQLQDAVRHPSSGQPSQVVYLNNGDFGLLVPNGYGSEGGKAALFILAVSGPSATTGWQPSTPSSAGSYRKIEVSEAGDSANGLMGATWVDLDNNGTADVVYATDLRGQLWKFDLRSANPAEWRSALMKTSGGGTADEAITVTDVAKALFTAQSGDQVLPITTAPVTFFPSFGGTMISFGTGRAIESVDFPDATVTQRFFTVWDKGRYPGDLINPPITNAVGQVTVQNDYPAVNGSRTVGAGEAARTVKTFVRRILRRDADGNVYQVQTHTNELGEMVPSTGTDGKEIPLADGVVAQAFNPDEHDGWYMEFPSAGEAVISAPTRRLNFVLFTTVRPQSSVEREVSCAVGPQGALYAFSPVSGLPIRSLLLDDGFLMGKDISDQKVLAINDASDGTPVSTGGQVKARGLGNSTDETLNTSASNLRIQWREVTGMRTRSSATSTGSAPTGGGAK